MTNVSDVDVAKLERERDDFPMTTAEATVYVGYADPKTLERRRKDRKPPPHQGQANPEACKERGWSTSPFIYLKKHLDQYRLDRKTPMHVYTFTAGLITGHGLISDPDAIAGSLHELLLLDWADVELRNEALTLFRREQQDAWDKVARVQAAADRAELERAVGATGKDGEPGVM
ncbi:hypothetical protein [Pseudoxanthomonas mexicana]